MSTLHKSFASDNHSGICSEILDAICQANQGHCLAYGEDEITQRVQLAFREVFGPDAQCYFVFNGTAANVLSVKALCKSYEAVLCSHMAHIATDECGALESLSGNQLICIPAPDGKLTKELIKAKLHKPQSVHRVSPKMISLTQSTEGGTVYSLQELREIADFARESGLLLHIDGARLSNAAASLDCSLKAMTTDIGVDVVSFGGTKNGLMGAEAVVFLKKDLALDFKYFRKQSMQLASKMRFISAQFEALLKNDLYLINARHANQMAQVLAKSVQDLPGVTIAYPVEANGVFAKISRDVVKKIQEKFPFYVWQDDPSSDTQMVRWMTSFDTTQSDVEAFVSCIKESLGV